MEVERKEVWFTVVNGKESWRRKVGRRGRSGVGGGSIRKRVLDVLFSLVYL